MLTITNGTPTHLVLPGASGDGTAMKLPPGGTVQVERLTAVLTDAEKHGLVVIHRPGAVEAPVVQEADELPGVNPETDGADQERDRLILALLDEGKTQREVATQLGINRNVVQRLVRKLRGEQQKEQP
jgi:hypothetical protein